MKIRPNSQFENGVRCFVNVKQTAQLLPIVPKLKLKKLCSMKQILDKDNFSSKNMTIIICYKYLVSLNLYETQTQQDGYF
ncbi:hypothetical protein KH5_07320 [Urechidicola sp. KH5]